MGMPRWSSRRQSQLIGYSTKVQTGLVGPWFLLHGTTTLRVLATLRALEATFGAKIGYRTAAVLTDQPDAWTDSATGRSTAGQFVEDFSVGAISSKLWIQPRIGAGLTSGATSAEAFGMLQAMTQSKGVIVAATEVEAEPSVNSGETAYVPVGDLFPALDLAGIMAGFTVFGVNGTLAYGVAIRYFDGDPTVPGAWVDLASYTSITADETRNSGDLSTTPGTKTLAQIGIKFSGTGARATIRAVVSARYS